MISTARGFALFFALYFTCHWSLTIQRKYWEYMRSVSAFKVAALLRPVARWRRR